MCLQKVKKTLKKTDTGYKIMRRIGDDLYTGEYVTDKNYKKGVWYTRRKKGKIAASILIKNVSDLNYKSGFHYFKTLKDAKDHITIEPSLDRLYGGCVGVKVKLKDIHHSGVLSCDYSAICGVADKMKIIEEV